MIPGSAILSCQEGVCTRLTRCQRTLSDAIGAVHRIGLPLTYSVPVDAGTIDLKAVFDSNLKCITPITANCGTWELAIDSIYHTRCAIWAQGLVLNLKSVAFDLSSSWPACFDIRVNVEAVAPTLSVGGIVDAASVGARKPWSSWMSLWVIGQAHQLCHAWHRSGINKLNE